MRNEALNIHDFSFVMKEHIRYNDMDAHGHVNNAIYLTYLEVGRIAMVHERSPRLIDEGCQYVVARITIEFRNEIVWPGDVELAARIERIGRSSYSLKQAIFQNGKCAALADVTIVQTNKKTRKSQPFSEALRAGFTALQSPNTQVQPG